MKKKFILVVEDDKAIQESLKELLESEDYLVKSVYDGNEALSFLNDKKNKIIPDLILLDIMMPTMDGEVFSNAIASYPLLSSIPVILISAAGNLTPHQKSIGNAFIKKPFDIDEIIQEIKKQLERGISKNGVDNSSRTSSQESQT